MNVDKRVLGSFWTFSSSENTLKRGYHSCVLLDSHLFVYGGIVIEDSDDSSSVKEQASNSFFKYNLDTGESISLCNFLGTGSSGDVGGSIQQNLPCLSRHTLSLVTDAHTGRNSIALFGGMDDSTEKVAQDKLYFYDVAKNKWSMVEKLMGKQWPKARYSHTASVVDFEGRNVVVVIGGTDGDEYFNDVCLFDTRRKTWKILTFETKKKKEEKQAKFTPPPLAGHSAVISGFGVYIFGGGNNSLMSNSTYLFHVDRLVWSNVKYSGNLTPAQRTEHTAVAIGNKMVVLGGIGRNQQYDIMSLDLEKKMWQNHPYVNSTEWDTPRQIYAHCVVVRGGELWIVGGKFPTQKFASLYKLDTGIRSQEWKKPLRSLLPDHFARLVNDRRSSDVIFDVRGVHVYAHRAILRARCLVLFRELSRVVRISDNVVELSSLCVKLKNKVQKKIARRPNRLFAFFIAGVENLISEESNRRDSPKPKRTEEEIEQDLFVEEEYEGGEELKIVLTEMNVLFVLHFIYCGEMATCQQTNDTVNNQNFELDLLGRKKLHAIGYLAALFNLPRLCILCMQSLAEEHRLDVSGFGSDTLFADYRKLFDMVTQFSLPGVDEESDNKNGDEQEDDEGSSKSMSIDSEDLLSHDSVEDDSVLSTVSSYLTSEFGSEGGDCACDMQIDVDDPDGKSSRSFFTHRCIILARCSKLLTRLMDESGGMTPMSSSEVKKEINLSNYNHVVLDSIRGVVFHKLLEFIYTGDVQSVPFDIALELLVACEEFDLPRLSAKCQRVIDRFIHVHNVCRILSLLNTEKIARDLRESCVVFIANRLNRVRKTHGYRKLAPRTKYRIKEKRKMLRSLNQLDYQHEMKYSIKKKRRQKKSGGGVYEENLHKRNFLLMTSHSSKKKFHRKKSHKKKRTRARQKNKAVKSATKFMESDEIVSIRSGLFGGGGGSSSGAQVIKKRKKRFFKSHMTKEVIEEGVEDEKHFDELFT